MTGTSILVTGAAGFIGSTLCQRLVADGHRVTGIDALTDSYSPILKKQNLQALESHPGFSIEVRDIHSVAADEGLLARTSHIIHLAAQPGVRNAWGKEFDRYIHANISATQHLLEVAKSSPHLNAFVYASSSSVYGDSPTYPSSEQSATHPFSPYGVTKLAGEHLATVYASNFQVPVRSLRFFTVYGPRQRPDMAFTRFMTKILNGEPLPVYGDGAQLREFTYVDDVVDAIVRAAFNDLPLGTVMNVSGGSTVSLTQIFDILRNDLGLTFDVHHHPAVPGDVRRTGGTTELISQLTGWRPDTPLPEGLARQWEWAQRALGPANSRSDATAPHEIGAT